MEVKTYIQDKPKSAYSTLTAINRLLKVFCLTGITCENEQLKINYMAKYIQPFLIFFTIIVGFTSEIANLMNFHDKSYNLDHIIMLITLIQYIVGLIFVFKNSSTNLYYFKLYDHIDKILGMITTYNSCIQEKVSSVTFVCVCSLCGMFAIEFFGEILHLNSCISHFIAINIITEYVSYFINTITILEFCANIIQIEYRLKTIKDILQDFCIFSSRKLSVVNVVRDKNWFYFSKENIPLRRPTSGTFVFNNYHDVILLKKCYLLLIEQRNFINKAFGLRVSKISYLNNSQITFPFKSPFFFFQIVLKDIPSLGRLVNCLAFMIRINVMVCNIISQNHLLEFNKKYTFKFCASILKSF